MSGSRPRLGMLVLSALSLFALAAPTGELSRPVPPDAQVTRFTRFNLRYSLRDVDLDSIQRIEFFITEDMGRTWRFYGEDADRTPPMTIEVPGEGVYGFVSVATDRFGNREREPVPRTRPETVIVVDRTPPQAKWLAPLQNALGRGRGAELAWEAGDLYFGPAPVKLQYAVDARSNHDRDAVWNSLQDNLPASGKYFWTPLDGVSGRYNFRLVAEDRAGNLAVAYCPATIIIDNSPPVIASVSPLRANKLEVPVVIEADDGPGGSGVKEISLYVSDNSGGSWTLIKESAANGESRPAKRKSGQAILFTAPRAGDYALWPVAFDEAGNATPLPSVGSPGPYVLTIDNEPPTVSLQNSFLMGRSVVLANESRSVSWTAYDPHILANSAIILLSLDNGSTWQLLRSGLPTSGTDTVYFPFGAHSEEAKLKVTVADEFGNVGESVSDSFRLSGAETVIDSVTPIQGASSLPGGFNDIFGGDSGQPPYIPPPPTGQTGPGYPPPLPAPTQSPVASQLPFANPLTGQDAAFDPVGDPFARPGASYPPATPLDSYQYPPIQRSVPGGESTATSVPRAMLGDVADSPGGLTSPFPPAGRIQPPPMESSRAPAPPQSGDWIPTPANSFSPIPSAGSEVAVLPPAIAQPPTAPPGANSLKPPPSDLGVARENPPSLFGDDWMNAVPGDWPNPTSFDSTPSENPSPNFGGGSLFDNLPGDLAPPSLPALPGERTPAPPPAGAQPPATPLINSPTQLSPLPDMDNSVGGMTPPPLAPPAAPTRPDNTRQLSERHIAESKRLLDDNNPESAMQEAKNALNADESNYHAYMALSQVYAHQDPQVNNFARAATLAKEAANLGKGEWDAWWNCADVFYRWAHRRNLDIQGMSRGGQRPPSDIVDERNQALANAQIAIGNSATLARSASEIERKKVAVTQGLIAYLQALTVPEPVAPPEGAGQAALDEYSRSQAAYKTAASRPLTEALPYFQAALRLGTPAYTETFHLGIINFRLGGLEKGGGNLTQAVNYYQQAARFLDEATTAGDTPPGGPREAYYMLAYCYDLMAESPGPSRARNKELALRYWRQTADFYAPGTAYRDYALLRIEALSAEMGR